MEPFVLEGSGYILYLCSVMLLGSWVDWRSVGFYLMKCVSLECPLVLPVDRTQALQLGMAVVWPHCEGFGRWLDPRQRSEGRGMFPLLSSVAHLWAWLSTL